MALGYLLFAAGGPLLVGCQDTAQQLRHEEVQRIAAAHERYLKELEVARADFQRENPMPLKLDYGTSGTLLLHECSIAGLPGSEKLRLKFTFLNVTGLTIPSTKVVLTLIDKENDLEWSEIMELELPFGLAMGHNSSYSSFFEMPMNGLHRRSDWDWRVELDSERAVFPGSQASR